MIMKQVPKRDTQEPQRRGQHIGERWMRNLPNAYMIMLVISGLCLQVRFYLMHRMDMAKERGCQSPVFLRMSQILWKVSLVIVLSYAGLVFMAGVSGVIGLTC